MTPRAASSSYRLGAIAAGIALGGALAVVFAWALETQSYNVWGAILVIPALVALNIFLIWQVSRRADEPWLAKLLGLAYAAKAGGALVRYVVAYVVYDGVADAERYNLFAASQYELWRQGIFALDLGGKQGTQYMELITTAIYTVIGPSPLAGFMVFGTFAFWGQYLLFRAFRIALPDGDGRRYALLVLLLPSLLYWPSSIGKESWLVLFVGLTALGAAKYFARRPGSIPLLALGAAGAGIVRPHVALLLFAGLVIAQLFRPAGSGASDLLAKGAGILMLGGVALVLTTQSASLLGIDDLSWQAVSESVDWAAGQTTQGGSAFAPTPLDSPTGVLAAAVTVLFRPFPWEATNAQMLIQSLEGVFIALLTVKAWPRLRHLPRVMRHSPYVTFALGYSLAFIVAFSGFGNFGIIARQRVLLLPFFLVLLALPTADKVISRARTQKEREGARV